MGLLLRYVDALIKSGGTEKALGSAKVSRPAIDYLGIGMVSLGAAGLKVTQHWKVPDAALLKNLADVWRRLGRQPTWRELTKRGGFSKFAGADAHHQGVISAHSRARIP